MATTSQVRAWWSGYECTPSKYSVVTFPGLGRTWALLVATPAVPVFDALSQVMVAEGYLFLESAGGTYNCRPPSLHAYALAIDINPSKNPYQCPLVTDMPVAFVDRVKSIKANGKQALTWGGDWPCSNPPDPMHFQINVAPADCKNVTWDQGDDMLKEPVLSWAIEAYTWAISTKPTQVYKADTVAEIRETADDQREMVFLWRAATNFEATSGVPREEYAAHRHGEGTTGPPK
jgi:hypothetical protein